MDRSDSLVVDAVLTGTPRPLGPRGELSAIAKCAVEGRRRVGALGIAGDTQADLSVHGGPDKAIHHYPRDHYADWVGTLGSKAALDRPGAFGENISTNGWTEDDVCLGDRLRLGSALVEIAQGRQPCWKQAEHLQRPDIVARMVRSGMTGWYYRVLEEGEVGAGDRLALVDRTLPQWPVSRLFGLLIGGRHRGEQAALSELAALPVLADGWRTRAAHLAQMGIP